MDRRRIERTTDASRHSLERALGTWLRLRDAWQSIFDVARSVHNYERMALAEAKLDECNLSIIHIKSSLNPAEPAI